MSVSVLHIKIAKVCCKRLLLAHSTNLIKLTFMVVRDIGSHATNCGITQQKY